MNKCLVYVLVLFMFFSFLSSFFPITNAEVLVIDTTNDGEGGADGYLHTHNVARLNNGTIIGIATFNQTMVFLWSDDNGSTWSNNTIANVGRYYNAKLCVDSDDDIALLWSRGDAAASYNDGEVYFSWINFDNKSKYGQITFDSSEYMRDIDMCIDENDDIWVVWRHWANNANPDTNVISYKKYTEVLSTWSAEVEVIDHQCLRNDDWCNLKIVPTYYSGSCVPYVYFTAKSTSGIFTAGTTYVTWYPFYNQNSANVSAIVANARTASSDTTDDVYKFLDVVYDKAHYEMLVVSSLSNKSLMYSIFSNRYNTLRASGLVQVDGTYDLNNPTVSLDSNGYADIIWSQITAESANAQLMHRQFYPWARIFTSSTAYLTAGSDQHYYPVVLYSPYPSNQIPSAYYFLTYRNETSDEIVFYDTINPIWTDYYSGFGEDVPAGFMGINCYEEINGTNITGFSVLFVNQTGDSYYAYNLSNTFIVAGILLPQGENLIMVSATNYYPRSYVVTIEDGHFYIDDVGYVNCTIDAYLPYINASNLYLLNVVGPPNEYYESPPVENVSVLIKGFCGNTSYEEISHTYTDGNGQTYAYLLHGRSYQVTLTKSGYITKTETYIPDPVVLTHTFRMYYDTGNTSWNQTYLCNEEIDYSGYIIRATSKMILNYTDRLNKTLNTKIVIYEYRSNFSNETTLTTISNTSTSIAQHTIGINNSRSYRCVLYINHTNCGYMIRELYFPANRTTITTQSKFNLLFTLNYGYCPFGWSNIIMWLIMVSCLFSFGRRETYMSAILCGFVFLFINYSIGFYTAMSAGAGVGIPVLFIVMGILMIYRDRGVLG